MTMATDGNETHKTPTWLYLFCFALMGPAVGINGVLVGLAIPATAQFGMTGMVVSGMIGVVLGILPAIWLARRIGDGIREDR